MQEDNKPKSFEEYILRSNKKFPATLTTKHEVLNDEVLVHKLGGLVKASKSELFTILDVRINLLKEELYYRAEPVEVLEIRRSIMELEALKEDCDSYEKSLESILKTAKKV